MKLGTLGFQLLQDFEKCRLIAYQDGGGVWTIGWGHTGPEVVEGLEWSQKHADGVLEADVEKSTEVVAENVSVPVNQHQFDALVSFEFNTGALVGSTLLRKLNAGDYAGAAAEFGNGWDTAGGVFVQGLKNRRMAEQALFNKE